MADIQFTVEDRRKRGYFTVDNVLLDVYGAQLGPHGIAVYTALARFANGDSECWPSLATIAGRTGMSRRHVVRMIAQLETLKIIAITPQVDGKGNHKSNLYTLIDIVGGGDSQSLGVVPHSHQGSDSQSPKQSLKKKYTPNDKKEGKSYRPDKYSDIILG